MSRLAQCHSVTHFSISLTPGKFDTHQTSPRFRLGNEPSRRVKTERGDYRGFYANVRDAIDKGSPLEVSPEQALRTMRGILLSYKSSREGRRVRWTEAVE
jgi:predicted dehydrogenase